MNLGLPYGNIKGTLFYLSYYSNFILRRRNQIARNEGKSKFNVSKDTSKRTYDEIVFDSELEMKYYRDVLTPLVKSGEVIKYELQKSYELQPKFKHDGKTIQPIKYVADFFIVYKDGHEEVIDTKGCPDSIAILKRKLFWYNYPTVDYKWICYSKIDGGWCNFDYVKKQRALRKKNKSKN